MERMRACLAEELRGDSPAVGDMTDHLSRFEGKQLRGAVVLLSGQTTGNSFMWWIAVEGPVADRTGIETIDLSDTATNPNQAE
jgi:geranylgeranyl pyrophosphate synthase